MVVRLVFFIVVKPVKHTNTLPKSNCMWKVRHTGRHHVDLRRMTFRAAHTSQVDYLQIRAQCNPCKQTRPDKSKRRPFWGQKPPGAISIYLNEYARMVDKTDTVANLFYMKMGQASRLSTTVSLMTATPLSRSINKTRCSLRNRPKNHSNRQ